MVRIWTGEGNGTMSRGVWAALQGQPWLRWTLLTGAWYRNDGSQLVHITCSLVCEVTAHRASEPLQAAGFVGVESKIKLSLSALESPVLLPGSGPHSVNQRTVGWRLCCLPSNMLRNEFVGYVFSEVPRLILFCFFHVCHCTYKFDIFDSVLPLSNTEFSTLDPLITLFRWYFCWIFFFIYCFLCLYRLCRLTHSNADVWMHLQGVSQALQKLVHSLNS